MWASGGLVVGWLRPEIRTKVAATLAGSVFDLNSTMSRYRLMITGIPRAFPFADGLRCHVEQPRQSRAISCAIDDCANRISVHGPKYRTDSSKFARTDNSTLSAHASGMDHKAEFSSRLNDALDAIGYPEKGKGRQVRLGKDMQTSQKGARKWLEGRQYRPWIM